MKIKDLTNIEMKRICLSQTYCDNCPLARWEELNGQKFRVLCYKKCRALDTVNIQELEQKLKEEKDEIMQDYYKDLIAKTKKDWQEREENEFKL